jgi:Tfp pilus assembly protein PilF
VDPVASEKQYLLGADYFNKNLIGPALEELLKAVQLDPGNADAHNLLGLISLRKGAESEELATRTQCLAGEELRLEKQEMDTQFKKAEEQFKQAVAIKPTFSEALNNLAVIAIHFGRYDEAIQFAEKALANIIYREPFAAEGNLGWAYLSKNDYARAAKTLRQALFEQPQFCVGRYRLAKVYYEQKEWDRAAEELDKVTGDKACPIQEAYHLAGLVALRRSERPRAAELFQKCVQLAPKSCLARECTLAANP